MGLGRGRRCKFQRRYDRVQKVCKEWKVFSEVSHNVQHSLKRGEVEKQLFQRAT